MKPSQLLAKLAWDKSRRQSIDYSEAFLLVSHENPALARAADSGAHSLPEIANDRAHANRAATARKKNAARQNLVRHAQQYQDKYKVEYADAWTRTLANPQFANDVATMNTPLPSADEKIFQSDEAGLLGLSVLDQDETRAAFEANGKVLSPVDYPAVFAGVKDYWKQKSNLTDSAAEQNVRARHRGLAQRVAIIKNSGAYGSFGVTSSNLPLS